MLKLITYHPAFGLPTATPFGAKAMWLLEMSGQEWEVEFSNDPRSGPKQKLPVLVDDGEVIPDSDAIRTHLEAKYNVDFDKGLSEEQRAISRAIIRMTEEHLYFALVCNRWLNDENWEHVRKAFFGQIPRLVNGFITKKIRKGVRAAMYSQGMGRHSVEEQFARADHDISTIQTLLGDKPFLFGDKPTAADASVVPMLAALAVPHAKTVLHERVASDATLMAYIKCGTEVMLPA